MDKKADKHLKPFNRVIQVCPICGKIDAYKGDNHSCQQEHIKKQNQDSLWD